MEVVVLEDVLESLRDLPKYGIVDLLIRRLGLPIDDGLRCITGLPGGCLIRRVRVLVRFDGFDSVGLNLKLLFFLVVDHRVQPLEGIDELS